MEQVTSLIQKERVWFDPDRLDDLFSQMGQHAAEDIVCRALEEVAARLGQIDKCYRAAEWDALSKSARGLGAIADQLGIALLARVARDVKTCAERGDPVATAATIARLMRVGERSLTDVWDMPDI